MSSSPIREMYSSRREALRHFDKKKLAGNTHRSRAYL